jgi:hypothetical protein
MLGASVVGLAWPMTTSSIISSFNPAEYTTSLITGTTKSSGKTSLQHPPIFPTGVRLAVITTTCSNPLPTLLPCDAIYASKYIMMQNLCQ